MTEDPRPDAAIVLTYPRISLPTLAIVLGVWLHVFEGHADDPGRAGHVVPPPRRLPDDGPRHVRRPPRCP